VDVERIVAETISKFGNEDVGDDRKRRTTTTTTFGIHCHNDCVLAVANSLMTVRNVRILLAMTGAFC
jgi:isopropylmalate/homocitrate/citramalate synthase